MTGSGILDPRFYEEGDSCMADKGFTITDDFKALNIEFNIPASLSGRYHVHVECAMRRIKTFKVVRNEILLPFHGSINQLWTVTC